MSNTPAQDKLTLQLIDHFTNSMPVSVDRDYAMHLVEAYKDNACREMLDRLADDIILAIDFERNNLKSEEK